MNCLLLFTSDLKSSNHASIKGQRASDLIREHSLVKGLEIKVSVLDEGLGTGSILAADAQELEISFSLNYDPPPRVNIELISAVTRPQTVKKILHLAAACGIKKVNFIPAESSQKSYMQSSVFQDEGISKEMHLALEQVFDCYLPEIVIHTSYKKFIAEISAEPEISDSIRFFADVPRLGEPDNKALISLTETTGKQIILALGPESGWCNQERFDFKNLGFSIYSLGPRIFRTETALAMILGQLVLSNDPLQLKPT